MGSFQTLPLSKRFATVLTFQTSHTPRSTTYEIKEPTSVGVPESRLVLGMRSGRHALTTQSEDLGVSLNKERLDGTYDRFTAATDLRKDENAAPAKEVVEQSKSAVAK